MVAVSAASDQGEHGIWRARTLNNHDTPHACDASFDRSGKDVQTGLQLKKHGLTCWKKLNFGLSWLAGCREGT